MGPNEIVRKTRESQNGCGSGELLCIRCLPKLVMAEIVYRGHSLCLCCAVEVSAQMEESNKAAVNATCHGLLPVSTWTWDFVLDSLHKFFVKVDPIPGSHGPKTKAAAPRELGEGVRPVRPGKAYLRVACNYTKDPEVAFSMIGTEVTFRDSGGMPLRGLVIDAVANGQGIEALVEVGAGCIGDLPFTINKGDMVK